MSAHPTEWTLRRLHTGELSGAESSTARAHLAHIEGCPECRQVLQGFKEEQARFEAQLPFEHFATGVEQARGGGRRPITQAQVDRVILAVAATVLLVVVVRPLMAELPTHRLKGGGASADLRIGGTGSQRAAVPGSTEIVQPDERVRLGYTAGPYPFLLAISLDDTGEFSTLYATEDQRSLPVDSGPGRHWLPDSLSFTGTGNERVVMLLSSTPLEVQTVKERVYEVWRQAGRQVAAMPSLHMAGEEIDWVLEKP